MLTLEQQDYQKSIIAFIAGLFIGGLVIWVFTEPSETATPAVASENQAAAVADADGNTAVSVDIVSAKVGTASVSITDAAAGDSVGIAVAEYPAEEGWVAVREVINGVLANVLGASRYSVADNRLPSDVNLYRGTVAGNTYRVVFYTADEAFDLKSIEMIAEGENFVAK